MENIVVLRANKRMREHAGCRKGLESIFVRETRRSSSSSDLTFKFPPPWKNVLSTAPWLLLESIFEGLLPYRSPSSRPSLALGKRA